MLAGIQLTEDRVAARRVGRIHDGNINDETKKSFSAPLRRHGIAN